MEGNTAYHECVGGKRLVLSKDSEGFTRNTSTVEGMRNK